MTLEELDAILVTLDEGDDVELTMAELVSIVRAANEKFRRHMVHEGPHYMGSSVPHSGGIGNRVHAVRIIPEHPAQEGS